MAKGHVKKRPQRTCVGCRRTLPKRDLVRLVRTPSGEILIDPTGKAQGRGVYLCPNRRCWTIALKKRRIGHALRTALSEEAYARMEAFATTLPDVEIEDEIIKDVAIPRKEANG